MEIENVYECKKLYINVNKSSHWNIFYIDISLYTFIDIHFSTEIDTYLYLYIFSYILYNAIENFYFCKYTYL